MSSRTNPPRSPADPERRPFTVAPGHRQVRSFVLREGRLTPAQKRAFDTHWSRYGLDHQGATRDLGDCFGREAELVVEIGFGNGDALRHAANHEPHRNLVGIEVHRPGVGRLLNALAEDDREHVRVYCHDAVEVLTSDIAPAALDEVRIFFPDPWHKSRHHKRRLVQPEFVSLLASRIRPGGLLHLATDWAAYAEHMFDVLESEPALRNRLGPRAVADRPPWRPQTHFEQRGVRLGHGVWDLLYDRV